MTEHVEVQVLDAGYVRLVEAWGSDERIIESARMSTAKGFLGWGPKHSAHCVPGMGGNYDDCACGKKEPGDEKLLNYLWTHGHATPFEMAGLVIEVKAPIFVLREWMRHRTQSFNEMSSRYIPLPNENYVPSVERICVVNTTNKQAASTGVIIHDDEARAWRQELMDAYAALQKVYQHGLDLGVPKELARLPVPVGRYSCMRASANLRNWLAFLKLRCDPAAQWEIREYANVVASLIKDLFPRTYEVSKTSLGLVRTPT